MTAPRTLRRLTLAVLIPTLVALVQPGATAVRSSEHQAAQAARAAGWSRVFSDEFKRKAPGGSKWTSGRPGVAITSCGDTVRDPDQRGDRVLRVYPQPFATCRITSTATFGSDAGTYKFSARVKAPRSLGHYTSFWTNSNLGPYNEIDVFESYGKYKAGKSLRCAGGDVKPNTQRFRGMQSVVYLNDSPKTGRAHCWTPQQLRALHPFDRKWHVYTAVWNPGQYVIFSIDGRRVAKFGARYAVSSTVDLRLTDIDNNDDQPNGQSLKVDWVKVWRR
jgi:beta-glucanase (GH16 family)